MQRTEADARIVIDRLLQEADEVTAAVQSGFSRGEQNKLEQGEFKISR